MTSLAQHTNLDEPYSMLVGSVSLAGADLTTVFLRQNPFNFEYWLDSNSEYNSISYNGLFIIVPLSLWDGDFKKLAQIVRDRGTSNTAILTHAGGHKAFLDWKPQVGSDTKSFHVLFYFGVTLKEFRFPDYGDDSFCFFVDESESATPVQKKMELHEVRKAAEEDGASTLRMFSLPLEYVQFEKHFGCVLSRKDGGHLIYDCPDAIGYLEIEGFGNWRFYGATAIDKAPIFKNPLMEGKLNGLTSSDFRVTFTGTWKDVLHILETYYKHIHYQA